MLGENSFLGGKVRKLGQNYLFFLNTQNPFTMRSCHGYQKFRQKSIKSSQPTPPNRQNRLVVLHKRTMLSQTTKRTMI